MQCMKIARNEMPSVGSELAYQIVCILDRTTSSLEKLGARRT